MAPWRIEIDGARCDAHGICSICCPDLIALDEWGYALVDSSAFDDRPTVRRARHAVAACPNGALSLHPTSGPNTGRQR